MQRLIFALALFVSSPAIAQQNTINAKNNVPTFRWLHDAQTYQALVAQGDMVAARRLYLDRSPHSASHTDVGELLYVMHMKKFGKIYFYCVRSSGQHECVWTDDGAFL